MRLRIVFLLPPALSLVLALSLLPLGTGCGGDDDDDDDTGPAECPIGAPETGSACPPDIGQCTYDGLNPDCPPLVGPCNCVQGGWVCDVPECSTCNETCNGDCCDLDQVCRAGEGGLSQACGPEGDETGLLFEDCGHESDCAGLDPICSPICGNLCCTVTCEGPADCEQGTCDNGVCSPP